MAPSAKVLGPISEDGSIADIADRARQLLLCCQKIRSEEVQKIATAQLVRFNLWAANIGVFAPRHASLDYRLRTAPTVKTAVEGNLEILCVHLVSSEKPIFPSQFFRKLIFHCSS